MGMPPLKRVAASLPPAAKSRLHRETSNHSNLDSLLEDISLSQQHKENRCWALCRQLAELMAELSNSITILQIQTFKRGAVPDASVMPTAGRLPALQACTNWSTAAAMRHSPGGHCNSTWQETHPA